MKKLILITTTLLFACFPAGAADKSKTTADHLQDVSVTIRAEGDFSNGEGSGVIFSRKDADGNTVNFVWTAAHVIDNLRKKKKVRFGQLAASIPKISRKVLLEKK